MIGCGGAALACSWPSSGTAFQASKGPIALSSANETPKVGDSWPGKWMWLMWTRRPTTPAIATRPCLISAWRKKASALSPPIVLKPNGSNILPPVSGPVPTLRRGSAQELRALALPRLQVLRPSASPPWLALALSLTTQQKSHAHGLDAHLRAQLLQLRGLNGSAGRKARNSSNHHHHVCNG